MQKSIEKLVGFINRASDKADKEHQDFLKFYEDIVRVTPPEMARNFGKLKTDSGSIELTATDFMYWHTAINDGWRFPSGAADIKLKIFNHLAEMSESLAMTAAEKSELIDILKSEAA